MREIIFRGKRIDNGAWVYGCLLNNIYGASKPVIVSDSSYTDDNRIANDDWEFVIPETVGQYTGLTDKNGKKIFEGDILRFGGLGYGDRFGVLFYNEKFVKFMFQPKDSLAGYPVDYTCGLEVMGNIHDNSELLKSNNGS